MSGNVREWCADTYGDIAYSKHQRMNPIYTEYGGGSRRVIRGGSWNNEPRNVRCANRNNNEPANRNNNVGFRLVRSP